MKIERDFTFSKYVELCRAILNSNYEILKVQDYFTTKNLPEKFVIMRHDVDDAPDLPYTIEMARKEAEMGISSTYYFRVQDGVFDRGLIKEILTLGHEVGYHYDTLGRTEGNYREAVELFEEELLKFRDLCDVKTIAQHGGPLASGLKTSSFKDILKIVINLFKGKQTFKSWENKRLWEQYDFKKYGILGEAYLSIDFDRVAYFSDTGGSWADKNRLKDFVDSSNDPYSNIKSTNDLIEALEKNRVDKLLILTHPPNWKENLKEWTEWLLLQQIRNTGKMFLKLYWR